jgi:hypothetical protein
MPTPKDHADTAAEAIHNLNHATLRPGDGWTEPADAHNVIGGLADTARRLPQTIDQIQLHLNRLDADGHLDSAYRDHFDILPDLLTATRQRLADARRAAAALNRALDAAHATTASLTRKD